MSKPFVPHTVFLDDAKTKDGVSLVSFAEAVKMIDREYLLKLVCDSGTIKNPNGPVGARYVSYLSTVFGYLAAAQMNDWDEIQMSLRYMFPDHEKRVRIESILKFAGVAEVVQKGFKTETGSQVTTWKINNTFWKYISDEAVERIQRSYKAKEKTDTVVSIKTTNENGETVRVRYNVDGENDSLIKEVAKKYPYMVACQTIYNDDECKTNGRIYHPIQALTKENREAKLSKLHGCNMVTVDIKSSLPRLCLMVMGKRIGWNDDIYSMLEGCEDVSRDVKKLATTILFNAEYHKVFTVKSSCEAKFGDMDFGTAKRILVAANKLTKGIVSKAKRLGLRCMNIEGRMQTMMLQWALENDVPWFPMHDGGHCPAWAAEAAERQMQACIEQIISGMSFAERAEILEITEDELMQVMAGLTLNAEEQKSKAKRFAKKQVKTSDLDDGDAAFLRQVGLVK